MLRGVKMFWIQIIRLIARNGASLAPFHANGSLANYIGRMCRGVAVVSCVCVSLILEPALFNITFKTNINVKH